MARGQLKEDVGEFEPAAGLQCSSDGVGGATNEGFGVEVEAMEGE